MDALLDTSVIIEMFRGNERVRNRLIELGLNYGISTITLFELHCAHLKPREELMLEKLPKLPFDEESAKLAGNIYLDLKSEGRIPPAKDLFIAASAIAYDKLLVTLDSDFKVFERYGLRSEFIEG